MENKSHWELVIHSTGYYGRDLTAVCANCNNPLFCNPNDYMGTAKYGTVLYTGIFSPSYPADRVRYILESVAGSNIQGHLPRYCACCGAEMSEDDKFRIREKEIKED